MAGSQRLKRMADSVQRELSELIRQELKDPRLGGLVTISAVKVSADLGYAEVYVTLMGRELGDEQSEAANKETLDVLNKASGFLRHELSRRIKTRITPRLRFHY
ncbi:MAG: 30S ribosome-binding factor RbfA, partial [Acinetobacter junii]|nr:30S ribosome-binding factor RbfA [Acinetobacter junii]